MFISHVPAGYISSKLLYPRFANSGVPAKYFLWAGTAGAVAPDFDMLYFYLVDHCQHHHHTYVTHYPIVWIILLLASIIALKSGDNPCIASLAVIFSLNGLIHMLLDSIVGDIWWFAPFVWKPFAFFTVQARYKPWWLSFILHGSFALELAILAWGTYIYRRGHDA